MQADELRGDWLDYVEDHLGEAVKPKGRPRKDRIAQELGRRTEGEVFDRPTLLTLYKALTQNVLRTLDYPVSTGKEANVFHGTDARERSLAVKIFRVHTATFHSYLTYIQGDPRFAGLRRDRRQVIRAWVKKEYKNLLRFHDAGVRVPRPVASLDNVLVMEFIGSEGTPAPLLRDVELEDPQAAYDALLTTVAVAWNRAGLAHSDLSEYNVMVRGEAGSRELVLIDVGQAVVQKHPMAREFLERDLKNLTRYFRKLGAGASLADARRRVLEGPEAKEAERAGHPELRVEPVDLASEEEGLERGGGEEA